MSCSVCDSGALIEIRMRVGGSDVTFRRCGRCEAHAWESDGGSIPLSRVLDLARQT